MKKLIVIIFIILGTIPNVRADDTCIQLYQMLKANWDAEREKYLAAIQMTSNYDQRKALRQEWGATDKKIREEMVAIQISEGCEPRVYR